MNNISGYGLTLNLQASISFPAGFSITQFSDDADPVTAEAMDIGETAMGLNGDLIAWQKAVPIKLELSVIAGSEDDINLEILALNNKVGKGKYPIKDIITLTKIFADGQTETYINGIITNAPIGTGVASAGRLKTKTYTFAFENRI